MLAGRTTALDALRCSQAIPTFAIKTCVLAKKSHMFNICEACAAMCCDCDLWEPITQDKRDFLSFKKKSQGQNKKYNNNFRKVVISRAIPDALRYLDTSKYKRPHYKPNNDCLWKPAKCNNVRSSKQLRFDVSTEKFNGNQASHVQRQRRMVACSHG